MGFPPFQWFNVAALSCFQDLVYRRIIDKCLKLVHDGCPFIMYRTPRCAPVQAQKTAPYIAEIHEKRHDLAQAYLAGVAREDETPVLSAQRMKQARLHQFVGYFRQEIERYIHFLADGLG